MNWLIAEYCFTAPFSLKSSLATSSGGKTNLLPTMFSIKMALIDAAFRIGLDGEKEFDWIKKLFIRIKPPKKATVQNSFFRIQRESRKEVIKDNPNQVFTSTVALREYVIFEGPIHIAFHVSNLSENEKKRLEKLLVHINQLGKRGCFVQLRKIEQKSELENTYSFLLNDREIELPNALILQYLDDMGEKTSFAAINPYDEAKSTIGKDRIIQPIGVPYRLIKSSRGFSHYERME